MVASTPDTVSSSSVVAQRQRVRKRKPDARVAHLHNLQMHVHRLHQEVESLKLTRELLMDRQMLRADQLGGSYERIVREYFDIIKNGLYPDLEPRTVPGSPTHADDRDTKPRRPAEDFLRSIMDENVNFAGPAKGVESFIDQGKQYSAAFARNKLQLLDLKVYPIEGEYISWDNARITVTGWGQYSCYITLKTIEMIFPHIMNNTMLVTKLLGQHITGVGRYDFVFDTATSRVISTNADLNFVPVFMTLLHNPLDVAVLFNRAHISSDYCIGYEDAAPAPPVSTKLRMTDLLT